VGAAIVAAMILVLLGAGVGPLRAQVALEAEPATPVRGTLFRLRVTPTGPGPVDSVTGVVAGEPLHLRSEDGVIWTGLAPVPITTTDSLEVLLVLARPDGRPDTADTVRTRIAVAPGTYPSERLRVAPSMAQPDSAAQARISAEVAKARVVSRRAHQTPRQWSEPFRLPRPTRVTSIYGTGREFNGVVTGRHMGTDFSGQVGAPVFATNDGIVALVADFYLAGTVVYLDHGEGLISAYFHLSRTRVKEGDRVTRGQRIGDVGQSGRVTGPHLHWVTRYGGVTIDPMSVVELLGARPGTE